MKTFREIAEMHYDSEPTSTIDRIYKNNRIEALEKLLTEQLRLHVVSNSLINELKRRQTFIQTEPNGQVRETMIDNLIINL